LDCPGSLNYWIQMYKSDANINNSYSGDAWEMKKIKRMVGE